MDGGRLQRLPEILGRTRASKLNVRQSDKIEAMLEWREELHQQTVRAAHSLYGLPWWDHIWYRDATGREGPQLGFVRLVLCAVDGMRRPAVVVECMDPATQLAGCVLTAYGCSRFKWRMDETKGLPSLAVVSLDDTQRLEHVVPDCESLCERHGLLGTPLTIPDTPRERQTHTYFVKNYFPSTRNSASDTP